MDFDLIKIQDRKREVKIETEIKRFIKTRSFRRDNDFESFKVFFFSSPSESSCRGRDAALVDRRIRFQIIFSFAYIRALKDLQGVRNTK